MRTESGQQRAQEAFVFQSQTQGGSAPSWARRDFLMNPLEFHFQMLVWPVVQTPACQEK